jgi:hypothetical protein
MRVEDILYFSPNHKTPYLDLDDGEILLQAFIERVEEFYFMPAEKLNGEFKAFAKGVLILTAIDFIGDYFIRTGNSDRIMKFCSGLKSIKELDTSEITLRTKLINNDYRNGLIHEGRIKHMGQFFYGIDELIVIGNSNTMINPTVLLNETRERFYEYVEKIENTKEEMFNFKNRFKQRFEDEINALPE